MAVTRSRQGQHLKPPYGTPERDLDIRIRSESFAENKRGYWVGRGLARQRVIDARKARREERSAKRKANPPTSEQVMEAAASNFAKVLG